MSSTVLVVQPKNELQQALPMDQNPAAVYLAALGSAQSRRTMQAALGEIADLLYPGRFVKPSKDAPDADKLGYKNRCLFVPWGDIRFQHTQAIRAALAQAFKYTTANKMLSALRGTLKAAYKLGYMSPDEYAKVSDIDAIKGQTLPAGREVSGGELMSLVQVCKADKTSAGNRDVAMIGILYSCGLRRAELVALDVADFDRETGKLTIRSGKGNKPRTVYATNGTKTALEAWLVVRGLTAGPLFCRIRKGAKLLADSRLTTQAVYTILQSRAKQAGVKEFSPHDMRRTFVSDMLDRGADIATVAKLAGHASVTTTARYDRRAEETKRKAAGLLHFPF
jgi:site-specific recombinase XerD